MISVKEFLLTDQLETQTLYLPKNAKILTATGTPRGPVLFVLVPAEDSTLELRTFKNYLTDEKIFESNLKYIATYTNASSIVSNIRHLFEITSEETC